MCTDCLCGDLPYGLGHVHYDEPQTRFDEVMLADVIKGFKYLTRSAAWFIGLWNGWGEGGMMRDVYAAEGIGNIMPVYWHKPGLTAVGDPRTMVSSVETMYTGVFPSAGKITSYMSKDPTQRHNFVECPNTGHTMVKDYQGQVLNKYQKPAGAAAPILSRYLMQGQKAIVICAGSGGEVFALIEMGVSVVAVEVDKAQFSGLARHLDGWDTRIEADKAAQAKAAMAASSGSSSSSPSSTSSSSSSSSDQSARPTSTSNSASSPSSATSQSLSTIPSSQSSSSSSSSPSNNIPVLAPTTAQVEEVPTLVECMLCLASSVDSDLVLCMQCQADHTCPHCLLCINCDAESRAEQANAAKAANGEYI